MVIYFIGIGGIGVSALAQYYLLKGHKVIGSDLVCSEITENLNKKGIKIFIGRHKKENLPKSLDKVIYSPAIEQNNSELKAACKIQKNNPKIKILSYPQALGELTKKYFTIAVSGTHGKSTTSAMLALLLIKAKKDPTVIIGTKIKHLNHGNCRVGKSKYLIIEADEYMASFLNYWPRLIILTGVEADHLDYYKNLNNIIKTFKQYISHLPPNGYLVANANDKNIKKIITACKARVISYQISKSLIVQKIRKNLKVSGDHNLSNALAALTAARILKISDKVSLEALSEYKGSWRRFEEKKANIKGKKIIIISDYAHHPTEIKVTLKTAREKYPDKRICCIYQPHQYQRTYCLFNQFVETFKKTVIDKIIITDIFDVAGREEKNIKKKVNSQKLVKTINKKNIIYLKNKQILAYLKKNITDFDILIIMGAGDIYKIEREVLNL